MCSHTKLVILQAQMIEGMHFILLTSVSTCRLYHRVNNWGSALDRQCFMHKTSMCLAHKNALSPDKASPWHLIECIVTYQIITVTIACHLYKMNSLQVFTVCVYHPQDSKQCLICTQAALHAHTIKQSLQALPYQNTALNRKMHTRSIVSLTNRI